MVPQMDLKMILGRPLDYPLTEEYNSYKRLYKEKGKEHRIHYLGFRVQGLRGFNDPLTKEYS